MDCLMEIALERESKGACGYQGIPKALYCEKQAAEKSGMWIKGKLKTEHATTMQICVLLFEAVFPLVQLPIKENCKAIRNKGASAHSCALGCHKQLNS